MKKRIFSAVLACATAAALSLGAHATAASTAKPETEAVQEVELEYIHTDIEETYIKKYDLYEQVMYGQIVFYTNVGNGEIVSTPVTIELPAELEATFERDGEEIKLVNNAEISEIGSYSLTVIANGEDILGGKEHERYYGLFRFRIMEDDGSYSDDYDDEKDSEGNYEGEADNVIHVGELTEDDEDETSEDLSGGYLVPDTPDEPIDTESSESTESDDPWANDDYAPSQPESEPDDGASDDEPSASDGGDTDTDADDGGSDDTDADEDASDADAEEEEQAPEGDTSLIRATTDAKSIKLVTRAKTEIFTNIPPNMKTTGTVTFSTAADVQYKLYRNGKHLDTYRFANELTEVGSYQLFIYDGSGTLPAEFDFEITPRYVSGITSYEVPNGCTIDKVLFEGNLIRSEKTSAEVGSEGTYTVDMLFGTYKITETFILDNTAPDVGFKGVKNGKSPGGPVEIRLKSDDIDSYEVYLDGEKIKVKKLTLTEPGEYVVKVYDRAGNVTEKNFIIEFRMNEMGVIVIVLLCGLVVAGIVFFIRCKTKFIVR